MQIQPTDTQLLASIKDGDSAALSQLLERYKSMVNALARPYFLSGGDFEDLAQEGMIGLYKAVMTYRDDMQTAFSSYAYTCIKSKIFDVIKIANRDKHKALNNCVPITLFTETSSSTLANSPEDVTIENDFNAEVQSKIKQALSKQEQILFFAYLEGKTYAELASEFNKNNKAIDNSLQKIKKKIQRIKFDN
ncbi:MAG: sigma-70 family RNA polymerase sigma factor [Clostridia bacterium]